MVNHALLEHVQKLIKLKTSKTDQVMDLISISAHQDFVFSLETSYASKLFIPHYYIKCFSLTENLFTTKTLLIIYC